MESTKKEKKKKTKQRKLNSGASYKETFTSHNLDSFITTFHKKVREGPYYICSVCNRILYRKTVHEVKKNMYGFQHLFTGKKSFDDKEYMCKTCKSKLLKEQVPCQAVSNKLGVDDVPPEMKCREKLEQILVAQRIMFEKIVTMPKGQQRKIKGAICNVPVDCDNTCKLLPRPAENSGIIMLKIKRKPDFRSHVYFQAVRPDIVLNALNWLLVNNPLYRDITVNMENIDSNLTELRMEGSSETSTDLSSNSSTLIASEEQKLENDQDEEESADPLNEF